MDSFLLTNDLSKFDTIFSDDAITLIFSQPLIDELVEVTQRAKFKKYFKLADVERLMRKIQVRADLITVTSEINICRDPKDNFLLSLALDGNATHLLTGDKDLLVLEQFDMTKIMTISQYLSEENTIN